MKSYFQRGDSPTEDQFAELIDSVTNIHEDGKVTATASDGVRLFPAGKSGVAATVFTDDPRPGRIGTVVADCSRRRNAENIRMTKGQNGADDRPRP